MFEDDLSAFYDTKAQVFYKMHAAETLEALLLRYGLDARKRGLALQLESRRRAQKKLPKWWATSGIVFPPKQNLEQASSEITAQYKAKLVNYSTSADLTGGSGIDSWQFALQAKSHVFVEPSEQLTRLAQHNYETLGLSNVSFFNQTAEDYLATNSQNFDLIFIDPSRRKEEMRKVSLSDYSPDVVGLFPILIVRAKHVLIKVSPLADLSYLSKLFYPYLAEIHVVAVDNECKEVLLLCTQEAKKEPQIVAVNVEGETSQSFSFQASNEAKKARIATEVGPFLYEPHVAVLKAGAFQSLATLYGLSKLHPNTHLYTGQEITARFPGRVYEVLEVSAPYKLSKTYEPVNVAARNYPEKAEVIQKKIKCQQGNAHRLFATTTEKGKVFVVCQPIANSSGTIAR